MSGVKETIVDITDAAYEGACAVRRIANAGAKRERKATRRLILQGRGGYIHVRPKML